MCNFEDGFILCRCEHVGSKVKAEPNEFIWELRTLARTEWAMGRCVLPQDDIGNGLEAEWVGLNLNLEHCFDFDYTPQEGDNLKLYQQSAHGFGPPFLSFMFKDSVWIQEFYDEISEISQLERWGKIKPK